MTEPIILQIFIVKRQTWSLSWTVVGITKMSRNGMILSETEKWN